MMHAYDKLYLEKARTSLGRMLDFAVYDLKYELARFFDLFIASGIADRFEQGDFTILAGRSGIELAYLVLDEAEAEYERQVPRFTAGRGEEYWTGWALAYYQWFSGMRFADIIKAVPIEEIRALYSPYHEMDIRHFVEKMNEALPVAEIGDQPEAASASCWPESERACREVRHLSANHPAV